MTRRRWTILITVVLAPIALAGVALLAILIHSELTRPPDEWGWLDRYSVEQRYFTAQEAFFLIEPLVLEWHDDAFVTDAWAGYLYSDDPQFAVQSDGRNAWWHFIACSASAGKWVSVIVDRGSVGLGVYDKPWGYLEHDCQSGLPLDRIVASNVAAMAARCVANDLPPRGISPTSHDLLTRQPIPLSWHIDFALPQGGTIDVLVDGQTGTVVTVVRDSQTIVPLDELPPC